MAYEEARNYTGAVAAERSKPAIRDQWNDTQNFLRETREILASALNRLRGSSVLSGAGDPKQLDPDHIVFLGQQTVGLAGEVANLARELAEYI